MLERRMLPSVCAVIVLVCICLLPVSAEEAAPLSLQEAVRTAVKQNPNVTAARNQVEAARSRIDIARSGGRLQLDAAAQYTHTNAIGTFTVPSLGPGIPPRVVSAGSADNTIGMIRARQALYTGGRVSSQVDRAESLYDLALGRLGSTEAQIALQTQEAYYNALLGASLVESAEKSLAAARQQSEVATVRYEAGTSAKFDVLRAQTQVSEAEQNLVQAQNQAQLARVVLNRLLGAPFDRAHQLSSAPLAPFPDADVKSLIETALKQRPEVLSAHAQAAAADAGVRFARAERRPELGLNANYQLVATENPGQATGFTFMAALSQEIFDGGRISASISEAKSLRDESRAQLEETTRGIEQDVRQAYLNLDTARKTLDTAKARLAQAQEAHDIATVRYEAGVGTAVEVADALAQLAAARTNLDQANSNYNIAYARLQRALGSPPAETTAS